MVIMMEKRNQVQRISNMKKHIGCSKIILLLLTSIIVVVWFVVAYYPFCKLHLIESDYGNNTIDETILGYEERVETYWEALFLTKGMKFKDIPYQNETINIDLGWNNSITISSGSFKKVIYVNRICRYYKDNTHVIGESGGFIYIDRAPSEDSTYIGIGFEDKNQNSITIYKQPDKMPYGDKKYGFYIDISGLEFVTGKSNRFDY